jgi:hypothetical protein
MLRHFLLLVPLLFILSCNKNNDPKPDTSGLFIKFFGRAGNSTGFSIAESSDGFVLVGSGMDQGRSDLDIYVIKTDRNGNSLWEKRIGTSRRDEAKGLRLDASGNIHVVGLCQQANDSTDLYYAELNPNGDVERERLFGAPDKNEEGLFLSFLTDGGILMAGLRANTSDKSMYLIKYVADSMAWDREVGVIGLSDGIGAIVELADSSLIWGGTSHKASESNIRLVKSDNEGNMLWTKEFGELNGVYEYGRNMIMTDEGNLLIAGSTGQENTTGEAMYLLKSDVNGNEIWHTTVNNPQSGGYGITSSGDGGYLMIGYHQKSQTDSDFLLVKTDLQGSVLWTKEFGGTRKDYGYSIVKCADGGIAMLGVADVFEEKNTVVNFIKADKDGEINGKSK